MVLRARHRRGLAVGLGDGQAGQGRQAVGVGGAVVGRGGVPRRRGHRGGVDQADQLRAPGLIWATAVKVTVPPGSRVTVVLMLPVPLAAATLEPGEATAVQLTAVIADGNRSVTAWSTAVLGPALLTTMV